MSEFKVKAGWPDGSVAEQSIVAADMGAARFEIERRGGHVFEVRRKGISLRAARGVGRGRIKMNEFLIFNQELIALLKAGLPVVRSFEILLERQKSPTLRRVLADVRSRVNSGASISEAFAAEGDLFPRLYWTSLKAGEKSGEIETVLRGVEGGKVEYEFGGEYLLSFTIRPAGEGQDLLLAPFALSRERRGEKGFLFLKPLYRASIPVTLSQTLVVGASKEEASKSALILILLAQEMPRAGAETGTPGAKAADKRDKRP